MEWVRVTEWMARRVRRGSMARLPDGRIATVTDVLSDLGTGMIYFRLSNGAEVPRTRVEVLWSEVDRRASARAVEVEDGVLTG